jgi:UDPglucose 6-dehydrogenase
MKIFQTNPTTAEMVKYMANTYLATKVIFANQMAELCQELDVNYSEVKQMVVADHRIYDSHLDISKERGFGGKCFPKDLVALLGLAKKLKVNLPVLEEVWKTNKRIRYKRDWEEIPFAVSSGVKKTRENKAK